MTTTKYINAWDDNKSIVSLARRENGKKVVDKIKYEWYFTISQEQALARKRDIIKMIKSGSPITTSNDGDFTKIVTPYQSRYRVLESFKDAGFTIFEGDVKLYQRYLADEDVSLELDQKILYFDIETDDRGKGIDPGAVRILSIAAVDSDGRESCLMIKEDTDEEEKKMLRTFLRTAERYDILEGWYSEGFDLVAIGRRCELHGIKSDIRVIEESAKDLGGLHSVRKIGKHRVVMNSINHIDLMQKMKEMHYRDTELIKKVRSFSLNAVAEVFLGEKKVDTEGKGYYWMWENEPEFLKEYNLQDVRLLKRLDDKMQITKQKLVEHQILNARVNDFTSTKKIDAYSLRGARLRGKRLFSDKKWNDNEFEDPDDKYEGGYVFEPSRGIYNDVVVYDFASLYPSIIKTFNISPDSLAKKDEVDVITLPTGTKFSKVKGVLPAIIQDVLDERDRIRHTEMPKLKEKSPEWNNLYYRQYSLKVIANSMYGVMGAKFARYYKRECAEGITLTGQHMLKWVWEWFESRGHRPIYGDTDSIFVILDRGGVTPGGLGELPTKLGAECDTDLEKHIRSSFGIVDNHMHLSYEATFARFLMQDKKKYVGRKADGSHKLMGLETKKRDTLPYTERKQRELLDLLLDGDKKPEFYHDWIISSMTEVMNGHLNKPDVLMQKRLTKEIEDYANQDSITVKIAKILRETHKHDGKINMFSAGAYVSFIVTDGSKGLNGVPEIEYTEGYDPVYYWNRAIFPALQRTLKVAVPSIDWDQFIIRPRRSKLYDKQGTEDYPIRYTQRVEGDAVGGSPSIVQSGSDQDTDRTEESSESTVSSS